MWLGPAPWGPYHPYRCSGSYDINLTAHKLAVLQRLLGRRHDRLGRPPLRRRHFRRRRAGIGAHRDRLSRRGERPWLAFKYSTGLTITNNDPQYAKSRTPLEVVGTPGEKKAPKPIPAYKGQGSLQGDFIACVKSREKPFRDIEVASHTLVVCHTAGICYRLKRSLKWDQAKQMFIGDDEANRWVDRARREPWVL